MKTPLRLSLLTAAVLLLTLPPANASAASCAKKGYKTIDQSKYLVLQRGPAPKGDSTSDFGYHACRIKTGKRYVLGGNECFGNDLGRVGDYALANNVIAYEAYTCGDPEGEADAKTLNVASGVKRSYPAEEGALPGGGVQDYSITDIVVRPNGNVAWIALAKHVSGGNQTRYDVRRAIDQNVTRLDFGPDIVGDSLAYSGGRIFWLDGPNAEWATLP